MMDATPWTKLPRSTRKRKANPRRRGSAVGGARPDHPGGILSFLDHVRSAPTFTRRLSIHDFDRIIADLHAGYDRTRHPYARANHADSGTGAVPNGDAPDRGAGVWSLVGDWCPLHDAGGIPHTDPRSSGLPRCPRCGLYVDGEIA